MDKKKKELVLFYISLAAYGAIAEVTLGLGLRIMTLSPQVGGVFACTALLVLVPFVAYSLIQSDEPEEVHKEILTRFGNGCCGKVLFLFGFGIASIVIGVSIGAVASAIFPGAVPPETLALAAIAIGAIAPTLGFFATHHAIMPIAEKINHHIIEPIVEKVKGCFSSKEA